MIKTFNFITVCLIIPALGLVGFASLIQMINQRVLHVKPVILEGTVKGKGQLVSLQISRRMFEGFIKN